MLFQKIKFWPSNKKVKQSSKKINWKVVRSKIFGDTIYKKVFRLYLITIIIGAILLYLPSSLNSGWTYTNGRYVWKTIEGKVFMEYKFFDAFFFASSSFSDTGLVTLTTSEVFNTAGQFLLILLIQFGGFGFLAIIILLWRALTFKAKFSFEQRLLLHSERGNNNLGGSYKMIYFGFKVVLISELIGWVALTLLFYYIKPETPLNPDNLPVPDYTYNKDTSYYGNFGKAVWAGLFHVVSAANNAGFDILGRSSIQAYRNDIGNMISVVFLIQFMIGGIGYPIFYDLKQYFKAKKQRQVHSVSLFTKLAIFTYFSMVIIALSLILLFELIPRPSHVTLLSQEYSPEMVLKKAQATTDSFKFGWGKHQTANKIWNLIFVSLNTRSAGFSSLSIDDLSAESKWLLSVSMFIGGSPASTAGGVRVMTLFLIFAKLIHQMQGRRHLSVFKRSVRDETVNESFLVFIASVILILISFWIVSTTATVPIPSADVFFESISAFGTTGLSSGATSKASVTGQLALIVLMFIGQLGVSSTILTWSKKKPKKELMRHTYEDLRVS